MNRKYWYWINNIEGIGNAKIRGMFAFAPDPYAVFQMKEDDLRNIPSLSDSDIRNILSQNNRVRILEEYDRLTEKGVKFVFPYEEEYPSRLKELYDMPYILYYRGSLPEDNRPGIAIVGSRRCSEYGRHVAFELGRVLSDAGANVISGLALGIDSSAHRGAIMGGGRTFGVLAGGVDKCYPPGNYNLYCDIINSGGVISEFPGNISTKPGMFPLRNRIISGMSDAVIVVEAGKKSGSLITAAFALNQNRDVFAVPGRLGDPLGVGCNELISEGAMVVTDYDKILSELGLKSHNCNEMQDNITLANEEKMLYSTLLDFTPKSLETLTTLTKLDAGVVVKTLISLEVKGIIREIGKNFYVRVI